MERLILVVDDDEDVAETIERALRRAGHRVLVAHRGADALQLARENHPDLAVLDIMMPGMNGVDVCRHIRANPELAHMPLLFLTAKGEIGSRIEDSTPFTEGDVELLAVLGSQAAIAIDNARLFQEIQTAYQKLAELDHLKSEFISIAAHELRSPLAVVLTYAALLEAEATGQMRQHLGQVTLAAMQLKSIIDEMVSLREIDTGQAQVALSDVAIAETVARVLEDLNLLASRKHQHVDIQIPTDLPLARGDPRLVFLILSNLLSNAIKFTPEEGSITISAHSEEGRVVTTIRDTGVGIPEAELERIFQRFYQVEDSLRRKHGGIGLGLAIAREMANLVGGKIEVASKEGEGSAFSLSLPQA